MATSWNTCILGIVVFGVIMHPRRLGYIYTLALQIDKAVASTFDRVHGIERAAVDAATVEARREKWWGTSPPLARLMGFMMIVIHTGALFFGGLSLFGPHSTTDDEWIPRFAPALCITLLLVWALPPTLTSSSDRRKLERVHDVVSVAFPCMHVLFDVWGYTREGFIAFTIAMPIVGNTFISTMPVEVLQNT